MTNKTKQTHTPGPGGITRMEVLVDRMGGYDVFTVIGYFDNDRLGANIYTGTNGDLARLIAACPDLLAACKIVQGRYDSGESIGSALLPYLASGQLRAAIAKAAPKS